MLVGVLIQVEIVPVEQDLASEPRLEGGRRPTWSRWPWVWK